MKFWICWILVFFEKAFFEKSYLARPWARGPANLYLYVYVYVDLYVYLYLYLYPIACGMPATLALLYIVPG